MGMGFTQLTPFTMPQQEGVHAQRMWLLVPYFMVFCHKKQENLCALASLREIFFLVAAMPH